MAKQAADQVDELELAKQEEQRLQEELEAERKRIEDEFRGKQAQAQDKVRKLQAERAKTAHAQIVALVREYVPHLKLGQRNEIIKLLQSGGVASAPKKATKGQKGAGQKLPPVFQVGDTTWANRGHLPKAFREWDSTDEAKKWRAANPGQQWPPYKG